MGKGKLYKINQLQWRIICTEWDPDKDIWPGFGPYSPPLIGNGDSNAHFIFHVASRSEWDEEHGGGKKIRE